MKKHTRTRGMGFLFQMPGSSNWWIGYSVNGKRFRETSRSSNRQDAVKLLKRRIAAAQTGGPVGPDPEKTTLAELVSMIRNEYVANGRNLRAITAPLDHLVRHFGGELRAVNLTTDKIISYVTERQQAGAKNSTINRSLSALKRAFTLAERAGKLARRPHLPMLEENNARSGFLSHGEFLRLIDALPGDLRDPVAFLYYSGWRVNEMRTLQWRDVDRAGGVVRLRPEHSKSGRGRVLPLRGELAAIIERAAARRTPECATVFHRDGRPVALFRKSWASACKRAGLGAVLVHDLRRCAVRNMIRAGVPDKIAMSISGHQTRSIFDRYDIVIEADQAQAMDMVSAHLAAQPVAPINVIPLKKVVS